MLFFFLLHITCIYFAAVQLLNLQYYCIFVVQYTMLIIVYIELLLSKYFSIIAYFVSQYAVLIVVVTLVIKTLMLLLFQPLCN